MAQTAGAAQNVAQTAGAAQNVKSFNKLNKFPKFFFLFMWLLLASNQNMMISLICFSLSTNTEPKYHQFKFFPTELGAGLSSAPLRRGAAACFS